MHFSYPEIRNDRPAIPALRGGGEARRGRDGRGVQGPRHAPGPVRGAEGAASGKVSDPERRSRFVREAKAASALQHANIVTIHDIAEADGFHCIVMEHVEGRRLDEAIPPGGMKPERALKIAAQIASALAAAHGKGIVHRDLKPANVMVTPEGTVKVLDFGLAKLTEPAMASPDAETLSMTQPTEPGVVVGTVAYMSPEQAEGRPVDGRSDIFSFGAVLYEMLSGRKAFRGESRVQTLSAVIHEEPPAPLGAPQELTRIIARCLRKDPDRRFQNMKDVQVELEELIEESDSGGWPPVALPRQAKSRLAWILAAAGLMIAAAIAGAVWYAGRGGPAVLNPQMTRFTFDAGQTVNPSLSSDGRFAAYASDRSGEGNLDIYVQHTSGGQPNRLTRHEAEDYDPSISPDGSKIAFRSERDGGGIYVIDTLGGTERKLVADGRMPSFSPDGSKIAYFVWPLSDRPDYSPLYLIPSEGGEARRLCPGFVTDNFFTGSAGVFWSPDGSRILFQGRKLSDPGTLNWWTAPVAGGEPVAAGIPQAAPKAIEMAHPVGWFGEHVYFSRGTLVEGMNIFRIPIRRDTWQVSGEQQQITSGGNVVRRVSFASDGRMLLSSVTQGVEFWALPLHKGRSDSSGVPIKVTSDATIKGHGSLSRDGTSLAYVAFISWQIPRLEIRIRDLKTGTETVYASKTLPGGTNPQISPDGASLAYGDRADGKLGVFVGPAGNLPGKRVCTDCETVGFLPDSRRLMVAEGGKKIVLLDTASGVRTTVLEAGDRSLCIIQFGHVAEPSPDGRWLAFSLDAPGGGHPTFVAPLRDGLTPETEWIRMEGSGDNSWSPVWSAEGDALYMMSNRDGHACIWAQRLDPGTKRPVGGQFAVQHFHKPEASDALWGRQMFLLSSLDKLVVTMASRTGNLWMARLETK
jgi:Tol biopolymer transport system component